MASDKVGAYGKIAAPASFRKTWDQEEYMEKAREKDRETQERAVEAEEYARQGKKPPRHKKDDLPKPTELMKAREAPLELEKNLNKTMIVNANAAGGSAGQPGFYCDVCKRTNKDSVAYLDHINGRSHLRRIGQTTKVVKSTLNDVRNKIAELRAKTADSANSKKYDFEARIKEIKALEIETRKKEKEERKTRKAETKAAGATGGGKSKEDEVGKAKGAKKGAAGVNAGDGAEPQVDEEMMKMMGFGGFGGSAR